MNLNFRRPLFVLRHAESQANAQGLIASDPATAVEGWGLTERGVAQARAAVLPPTPGLEVALTRGVRILSSDFLRARQTAELFAARYGASVELTPALRERDFGPFEGRSSDHYAEVWAADARGEDLAGVETLASVVARLTQLLDGLGADDGRPLVLVSHGDVLQILLTRALGRPATEHRLIPPLANAEVRAVGV